MCIKLFLHGCTISRLDVDIWLGICILRSFLGGLYFL